MFSKTTTHNICCEVIIREVGIVGENRWLSGTFCLLYSPGSLTLPGTRSLPSMFCLLYLGWAWLGYFWCSATFLLVINPQTQNLLHFAFYTSTTLSVAKACYAYNIQNKHIYVCLTCTCARVYLLSCVSVCLLSCVCVFDDVYACVCAFHDLCVCMSFFDLLQLACRLSQSGRMGHCLLCVCNGCT